MAETRQERRNNFHRNRQERTNPASDKPYGHVEALPMTAGPKDLKVGEDELGNPVYQTLSGNRYVIKLKEDQRTPMRQFKEDTVPAVRDYLQNPTMPTREQIVDFGKDVVEEAYNMVERSVSGEGSLGDVYGSATMVGGLSVGTHVPENSLRIFGGKARIPKDKLKEYEELKAANIPEREAWQQTNLYWDNYHKQVRREFDLTDVEFDEDVLHTVIEPQKYYNHKKLGPMAELIDNLPKGETFPLRLESILKFDELYKTYPELRDLEVSLVDAGDYFGAYIPSTTRTNPKILLNKKYPEQFKTTLLHELQHAVQDLDKLNPGSSLELIFFNMPRDFRKEYNRLSKLIKYLEKNPPKDPGVKNLYGRSRIKLRKMQDEVASRYYNNRGELEARSVERRFNAHDKGGQGRESVEDLVKRSDLKMHPEALIRSEKHPNSKLYSDDDLKRPRDDLYDHMTSSSEVPNLKAQINLKDNYGFKTDNPGGKWLENKRAQSEAIRKNSDKNTYASNIGSGEGVTGYFTKPVNINPQHLKNIKGAVGEEATRDAGLKMKYLEDSIKDEGYKPSAILIHVREDGTPFIVEGNTRMAEAVKNGRVSIPVEIRYLRGAEEVDGPLSLQKVLEMIKEVEDGRD